MRIVAVALIAVAVAVVGLAGLMVMGDPYPISRIGLTRIDDQLVVVNAACPGERLLEAHLQRREGPNDRFDTLWAVRGDASPTEDIAIGTSPPGLQTVTPLTGQIASDDWLSITVRTTELINSYPMDFRPGDIRPGEIISFGTSYADRTAFETAVKQETPCGDPYGKKGAGRFMLIALAVAVPTGISGVALLVTSPTPASGTISQS